MGFQCREKTDTQGHGEAGQRWVGEGRCYGCGCPPEKSGDALGRDLVHLQGPVQFLTDLA